MSWREKERGGKRRDAFADFLFAFYFRDPSVRNRSSTILRRCSRSYASLPRSNMVYQGQQGRQLLGDEVRSSVRSEGSSSSLVLLPPSFFLQFLPLPPSCSHRIAPSSISSSFLLTCFSLVVRSFGFQAMHIQPHDKAILFNVAMIQQKAAEMLVALPVEKRSLSELKIAIEQATHAQKFVHPSIHLSLLPSLSLFPSPFVPHPSLER